MVIPHTFGRHLNSNSHLHILVSDGGLREDGTQWLAPIELDRNAVMRISRYAVVTLLREAFRAEVLHTDMDRAALLSLLTTQYERWWKIDIKRFRSKKHSSDMRVVTLDGRRSRSTDSARLMVKKSVL